MQTGLRNIIHARGLSSSCVLSQCYGGEPCRFGLPRATVLLSHTLLGYHVTKDEIFLFCDPSLWYDQALAHLPLPASAAQSHLGTRTCFKWKNSASSAGPWLGLRASGTEFKIYHSPGYSGTENEYVQDHSCSLFLQQCQTCPLMMEHVIGIMKFELLLERHYLMFMTAKISFFFHLACTELQSRISSRKNPKQWQSFW